MKIIKKQPRLELIVLLLILTIGTFLRFYRIRETLVFLGDQGRDAIVAKKILIDHDLTLIGPVTSVGNMYLGPFYYYFMVPSLALTYPDPIGPVYAVALVGILTVGLLYFVVKEIFDRQAALLTAFLYAISHQAVSMSRFSWNPNIAPIVSLGIIYFLFKAINDKKYQYLLYAFISFGILVQLHYVATLMGAVIFASVFVLLRQKKDLRKIIITTIFGILGFLLLSLPLIVFDFRHNFINLNAFNNFFLGPEKHVRLLDQLSSAIKEVEGRSYRIVAQLVNSPNGTADRVILLTSLLSIIVILKNNNLTKKERTGWFLLLSWLGYSIFGTSFYARTVADHYLGFVNIAPVILVGLISSKLIKSKNFFSLLAAGYFIWISYLNLNKPATFAPNNWTIDDMKQVGDQISALVSPDKKYNIVNLSHTRDYKGMNYRYFLETTSHPPENPETYHELDELFIINEIGYENPLDVKIYEIKRPQLKTIDKTVSIPGGPNIIKLVK